MAVQNPEGRTGKRRDHVPSYSASLSNVKNEHPDSTDRDRGMSSGLKRVYTDELRDSLRASDIPLHSSTPPELANALRSVGSRVRMNVGKGYPTNPPSFSKSRSTGTIFRSTSDTLRDIFPSNRLVEDKPPTSSQKRKIPQSEEGYESDGGAVNDEDSETYLVIRDDGQGATAPNRPMKALRKPRKGMLKTHSLPSALFERLDSDEGHTEHLNGVEELEEDWSVPAGRTDEGSNYSNTSKDSNPFEPMVLN